MKDSIFNRKQESATSLFTHQNNQKSNSNNIYINNKTNSSYNININNSSNLNSNYQSQSSDNNFLAQKKKTAHTLSNNSRNFSQANKISLNNNKNIITLTSNTTATSLITNQISNYNKCITDRNIDDNKIKNINIHHNKNLSQFLLKKKIVQNNNKDLKDISNSMIHKNLFGIGKKEINNNRAKNILKNKDTKYQLSYIENNNMNENSLLKKKIKYFKNSNPKININYKLKNQNTNINLNENKAKIYNNVLNIKKLKFSNLSIKFLDGKLIQGLINLNSNNNTESNIKRECSTDRPNTNSNYLNTINSQLKNKEVINEQYNNINNNYIIANIINNIKLNNKKKVKKKKISRNKSIKLPENKNKIYNKNLTSLNLLLKNTNIKNNPSSLKIKTIDLSKANNNKTPYIDYNASYNKKPFFESKINRKLFDSNSHLNLNKRNISKKRKSNNIKIQKKGKNYRKLINAPLKLTKKKIFQKEKKFNLEMNFSNNAILFDKLNILTFNYIHSLNVHHKNDHSKSKLNQGNYSDINRNIFKLFNNNRNSIINESKRDSNYNKAESINNIIKTNILRNISKHSKIDSKYMNSLSNYEINSKQNIKINNNTSYKKENKNIFRNSNVIFNKLNEYNKKAFNKIYHSNSPFNINCLLKKGNSKKNNKNNKKHLHSKSRNYKNNYIYFLSESKTNLSKNKTNKNQKSDKYNTNKLVKNYRKKIKNLSVAVNNINTATENNLENINKEKEKEKTKKLSFNNILYTEKNNAKNSKIEKNSNEHKLISKKANNSRNSLNKKMRDVPNINSIIAIKEKNQIQSDFSKKSCNILIPLNPQKNKTIIKEVISKKEKEKNPLIVEEYFDEILYSLLIEESEFISKKLINHNYLMDEENEISPEMRAMVVDWLLEIHQIFHFQEKCLFTTIQIIDKYLSKKKITIDQFQLLALTALNIASKLEEVEYPILDNFITISKNSLTKKEMINMENKVLSIIDYEIFSPTILDFYQIYAIICNLNPVEVSQGLYIMNIILIDINMLKYKTSILAFAVLEIIANENKINKLFSFLKEINKKAFEINGNKKNVCQILIDDINKEYNSNELANKIKYLFRTILKTHYHNAMNKFKNKNFYTVSSYTSI